jgi:succinate dehydrogenase / fumarate reductase flavoprotein subunit
LSESVYGSVVAAEMDKQTRLVQSTGTENPYAIWQEMGKWMTDFCTVVRYNDKLERTIEQLQTWYARYNNMRLSDTGMYTNQNLSFARALNDMLINAEAMLRGALGRNESRGAHFKPDFKERDDKNFLKTTLASWNPATKSVDIAYAAVDTSLLQTAPAHVRQRHHERPDPPERRRPRPSAGAGDGVGYREQV